MKTNRIAALDGLRGLLALLVVVSHVEQQFLGSGYLFWPSQAAVRIFFIMSSYVLVRGWGRYAMPVFLVRRLVRLWPTFAVCVLAGCAAGGVMPYLSWFAWSPIMVPVDPVSWSLSIEVRAMFAMPILVWCARGGWLRSALLGALWVSLLGVGFGGVIGLSFILGAALSRYEIRVPVLEGPSCQWLGTISYSLYLVHWPVLVVLHRGFGKWGVVAALPASLVVAYGLWWAVERPSIALARRNPARALFGRVAVA